MLHICDKWTISLYTAQGQAPIKTSVYIVQIWLWYLLHMHKTCADSERGTGGQNLPPERSQNIGIISNTGPDPL